MLCHFYGIFMRGPGGRGILHFCHRVDSMLFALLVKSCGTSDEMKLIFEFRKLKALCDLKYFKMVSNWLIPYTGRS